MNFGDQIWCDLSEEMSFETFAPIWSHVSENEKYLSKIQISQFFVETLPRIMHDFLGVSLVCTFRGDVTPICSYFNKNKKKIIKKKKIKNF